jgi:transcriptional regulator with XRE-family HTH domain
MDSVTSMSTHRPMSPDERIFFTGLGARVAAARRNADLTQQQLADALGISQPQLAFYEVGKRRVPVSLLPKLARALGVTIEALVDDNGAVAVPVKRGPVSKLQQQLDAISQLPKAEQRAVSTVLDAVLAQHGRPRQEAAANA